MNRKLEGLWQPLYAELGGEEAPADILTRTEVELAAGSYTVRFDGIAADRGTYLIEAAGLTLRGVTGPNAGRTIPCLCKFVHDTLVICYGLDGTRPEKFATTAGGRLYLVTYRRKSS